MSFETRLIEALRKGDFIPSRLGSIGFGYDLWAKHPNGDVIVHCGGNAGWFDWFTPIQNGEQADFELVIAGRAYRLVRGVDDIPAGFARIGDDGIRHSPNRDVVVRRRGVPTKPGPAPGPNLRRDAVWDRPYRLEQRMGGARTGEWQLAEQHRDLRLAQQAGERYYRFHGVGYRVVLRGEVLHSWQPEPQGADA